MLSPMATETRRQAAGLQSYWAAPFTIAAGTGCVPSPMAAEMCLEGTGQLPNQMSVGERLHSAHSAQLLSSCKDIAADLGSCWAGLASPPTT